MRHGPWRGRPGWLFFRFLFAFGVLVFIGAGLITVPILIFSPNLPGPPEFHALLRAGICLFAFVFGFALLRAGRAVFRGVATPLGNVMEAAEAVAGGDLSARVPETGGGIFRQLSRAFNQMAARLEVEDEQRRQFTADVAHELRNPIHIIQGNLEGILDGVYTADPEHIRSTLDETRLLTRLVDDLQTLTLAETGQLQLRLETVPLAELLEDIRTSFAGQAESLRISFETSLNPVLINTSISGDPERLRQVLGNLVANALRFTSTGGQISIRTDSAEKGIRITVEDTGAGIPETDLPFIFDRFWKGDKARTRRSGSGSGLGLAIARQLVRAHGGTIAAESEPGVGTRFTIVLPYSGAGE